MNMSGKKIATATVPLAVSFDPKFTGYIRAFPASSLYEVFAVGVPLPSTSDLSGTGAIGPLLRAGTTRPRHS